MSKRKELLSILKKIIYYKILNIIVSDTMYARIKFKKKKSKKLNIKNPSTYSEKIQFLKLYYRNPLLTLCSDKYYVNEYIKACGYEYILKETYGIYRNMNEIDLNYLPDAFFLKCNHMSGYNMQIKEKKEADWNFLKKKYNLLLRLNYYNIGREWSYKNIHPLILCEQNLVDENGDLPVDYKFYCFDGKVKYFMVSYNEYEKNPKNHKFDVNLNSIDNKFKNKSVLNPESIVLPENIKEMIKIANALSKPFPHVRVDLYNIEGNIYFGELTFYSNSGFINVSDPEMDIEIGTWINLKKYKKDFIKSKSYHWEEI